jgi:hypothetical protein
MYRLTRAALWSRLPNSLIGCSRRCCSLKSLIGCWRVAVHSTRSLDVGAVAVHDWLDCFLNAPITYMVPWVHMWRHGFTCGAMGSHVVPWVHMWCHGFTCGAMGSHVAPWVHMWFHMFTCGAMGSHVAPLVHMWCHGFTHAHVHTATTPRHATQRNIYYNYACRHGMMV